MERGRRETQGQASEGRQTALTSTLRLGGSDQNLSSLKTRSAETLVTGYASPEWLLRLTTLRELGVRRILRVPGKSLPHCGWVALQCGHMLVPKGSCAPHCTQERSCGTGAEDEIGCHSDLSSSCRVWMVLIKSPLVTIPRSCPFSVTRSLPTFSRAIFCNASKAERLGGAATVRSMGIIACATVSEPLISCGTARTHCRVINPSSCPFLTTG